MILVTNQKQLTFIFKPEIGVSQRIKRWSLFFSGFNYVVQHRPEKSNMQVDSLSVSSIPLNDQHDVEVNTVQIAALEAGPSGVISVARVRKATSRDSVLARFVGFVQSGWQAIPLNDDLPPYYLYRDELAVQDGVAVGTARRYSRSLRDEVLEPLHESHSGAICTRQFARCYVWWRGVDSDIKKIVQSCKSCAEQRRDLNTPVLGRWKYPINLLYRLHIDHAGIFLGTYWLVWVDAYSKYASVHRVKGPDASSTDKESEQSFRSLSVALSNCY